MNERITNGMLIALIINVLYSKAIGITQATMSREIGSDIWIATFFSGIQALIVILIMISIISKLPNDEPKTEGIKKIIIKVVNLIIFILLFIFFTFAFGVSMATYVFHLRDYFLPEAPLWLFLITSILLSIFIMFKGIEVIGRMALLGVVAICVYNILLLIGSIAEFDIRDLMPVFINGFPNTIWASRHLNADWSIVVLMVLVLFRNIKDKSSVGKSISVGVLFATGIIILWPLLMSGVLSKEVTAQYITAYIQMAKSAEIGDYFHRLEIFMILLGGIAFYIQITVIMYGAVHSAMQIYSTDKFRLITISVAILLLGFSSWLLNNHHRAMHFIENQWVTYSLWITIFVILLYLMLGFFYKQFGEKNLHRPSRRL